MNIEVSENKKYIVYDFTVSEDNLFKGALEEYQIDIDTLRKLSKDLGFSYDSYLTLLKISESSATSLVEAMSTISKYTKILLLVDDVSKFVIGYSLEVDRLPILNLDFIKRVTSLVESSDSVSIAEMYTIPESTEASVIIKKINPIIIEENYEGKESKITEYQIGVLLTNDELGTAYSRLVLYIGRHPIYLPASMYNTSTARYKRTTSSSVDALEVLVLRIIDDLREEDLYNRIYDLHFRYRSNKSILVTYEEYNSVLRVMRKIPTIIEESSYLESLLSKYDNFERKYNKVEDQKSSYIWRCTALGDITVGALVSTTVDILNEVAAPSIEYRSIRELLGEYVSTNRIAEEIAREDK